MDVFILLPLQNVKGPQQLHLPITRAMVVITPLNFRLNFVSFELGEGDLCFIFGGWRRRQSSLVAGSIKLYFWRVTRDRMGGGGESAP